MLPFIEALLSFTQINAIKEKSECLGFGSFSSLPCDHHHQLCIIFCVFWTAGVVAQLLSILLQVGDHLNWSQLPQMGAHTGESCLCSDMHIDAHLLNTPICTRAESS
jgi:hypothetical protein